MNGDTETVDAEEADRILVTSALPYIHGMPHLGNIVGSVLPADVYYRFQRLKGRDAVYICASDAHGTMYEVEAAKQGRETADLVYENHEKIQELFDRFNLGFSYYGITDSDTNKDVADHFFDRLDENGYIEEREMELPYCQTDEMFLADRWIEGECPECGGLARGDQCDDCGTLLETKEIIDPYCVHCEESNIEFRMSTHFFLQLQEFEDWLRKWLDDRPANDLTENQTLSWLDDGLEARCITRDSDWGFDVPRDGFEGKTYYVWFDAVLGYISATKEWAEENDEDWEDWWRDDENVRYVQFMGKDNIPFHTAIFPAMQNGTGEDWTYADKIMASGYLLAEDTKFSKSRGKGLTTGEALEIRDADYWRYVLMASYPANHDTKFSWDVFRHRVNDELVDTFGNFIHRTLRFLEENYDGTIPAAPADTGEMEDVVEEHAGEAAAAMEEFQFPRALTQIMKVAEAGNQYFQQQEPWEQVDEDPEAAAQTLHVCGNLVHSLAVLAEPFLPRTAEQIWEMLDLDGSVHDAAWDATSQFTLEEHDIGSVAPLFEKVDEGDLPLEGADVDDNYKKEGAAGGDDEISVDDFEELDLRVGTITSVEDHPDADRLYVVQVDVGDETLQTCSGLVGHYSEEELDGKQVVVLANLESAELRGVESECMVLAADDGEDVVLVTPERAMANGAEVR